MTTDSDSAVFTLTDDQREFRSTVRAFLEHHSPESEVRRVMESAQGFESAIWRAMADQLRLQGLIIPEEYGGEGFGFTELGLVLEEMGRALLPGPYFTSAVLTAAVLLGSDDIEACKRYLPGIASGKTIATLALTERSGRWDRDGIETTADQDGAAWTLRGAKHYVPDGGIADLVIVVARTDSDTIGLFAVENTDDLVRREHSSLDPTRRQAVIEFTGTAATRVGLEDAWPGLSRALSQATAALANEQVGGAQRCLDQAVAYVKVRTQFGRPVGSFQAIRHRCADLMLDIECARGVAQYAVHAIDHFPTEFESAAALAKAYCSDVYARAAAANIQLHGGIGFTWEHPAHMYYKRAKSSAMLLGDPGYHRSLLADSIGV
ncbi:acyl-CoA dehydrogenase family protein [Mycolicibacterium gadium]|uniref:Acyl-CoA/acyl-ACP dehydrogenase n=1 Tax=Mycolicibacterium gadium TaxID=1794 RepID=A0ABT6GXG4_MYCGU|nr:acyl-CoA dehydrogenase family protein [Mycolicibacterium gadium]MDG5485971.1 acyl-CoA/acyl-ACP dehydrogenase [Mycolicibacterium gadium]